MSFHLHQNTDQCQQYAKSTVCTKKIVPIHNPELTISLQVLINTLGQHDICSTLQTPAHGTRLTIDSSV